MVAIRRLGPLPSGPDRYMSVEKADGVQLVQVEFQDFYVGCRASPYATRHTGSAVVFFTNEFL